MPCAADTLALCGGCLLPALRIAHAGPQHHGAPRRRHAGPTWCYAVQPCGITEDLRGPVYTGHIDVDDSRVRQMVMNGGGDESNDAARDRWAELRTGCVWYTRITSPNTSFSHDSAVRHESRAYGIAGYSYNTIVGLLEEVTR